MKLTLLDKKKESSDAESFIFENRDEIKWSAGQFLFYTFPFNNPDERGITRYFTISSAPFEKNIVITTRVPNPASTFKRALKNMKIGDTIEATDPDGDFIIDDLKNKNIFIAGGIGITPYRSILKDLDHKNIPINATLLYANSDENFVFKKELEILSTKHPNFKIVYFISPKHIEKEDIQEAIKETGDEPIIWFSGPEKMTEIFEKLLKEDLKIPEKRLKFDYFPGYDPIR